MHILDEEEFVASAVVYPSSTEEVQKIVLWANNYRIPIFPISIGRNRKSIPCHVYPWNQTDDTVLSWVWRSSASRSVGCCRYGPTDEQDPRHQPRTCLVEPGVTFYALYEEIQARGYKHLWVDVPDLGGGSVLGNTLDRGVGYTVYGDRESFPEPMLVPWSILSLV
jgi:hypothetical protein